MVKNESKSGNEFLKSLDKKLWTAADKLRVNLDAAVYKHAVLGLIFLKYVSDSFELRQQEVEAQLRARGRYEMTDASNPDNDNSGEFLIYAAPDGNTRIEVRIQAETVWLTQKQLAELFQTSKQNVSLHLQNVFDEGELAAGSTVKKYWTVQTEGKREAASNVARAG